MSEPTPVPRPAFKPPVTPARRSLLPRPAMVVALVSAVALVGIVGFVSSRHGPFRVGGSSGGPLAVAAPGVSLSPSADPSRARPEPSVSAAANAAGEDELYPDPSASPSGSVSPQPMARDWSGIVLALDRARIRVFQSPSSGALVDADRPGSPAYRSDDATRALLAAQNLHAGPMRFTLMTVRVVSQVEPLVTLDVVDQLAAYSILDAHDRVVERRPARGAARWTMQLRRDQGVWRFVEISAAKSSR